MRAVRAGLQTVMLTLLCIGAAYAEKHPFAEASPAASTGSDTESNHQVWDKAAAAKYLDEREVWWQAWPHAQKDHDTVCVSCHTQVPYALARPALRNQLGEHAISDPERVMLDSIIKRVNLGSEAETFYSDAVHGPGKTKEARNAEAVNNALILTAYDVQSGHLQPATTQPAAEPSPPCGPRRSRSGSKAGAWFWQNFHFSPWEAPESEYCGAAMAALAVGMAPENYRDDPKIQPNLTLLRAYLRGQSATQPWINRVALLWASAEVSRPHDRPGARMPSPTSSTPNSTPTAAGASPILGSNQQGQSTWKRHDDSAFDLRSDGYATGIVVLALEENGLGKTPEATQGLNWILANQDKAEGLWPAWSVNVKRDPKSDVGKFMSDAATGFSVLALENNRCTVTNISRHRRRNELQN